MNYDNIYSFHHKIQSRVQNKLYYIVFNNKIMRNGLPYPPDKPSTQVCKPTCLQYSALLYRTPLDTYIYLHKCDPSGLCLITISGLCLLHIFTRQGLCLQVLRHLFSKKIEVYPLLENIQKESKKKRTIFVILINYLVY